MKFTQQIMILFLLGLILSACTTKDNGAADTPAQQEKLTIYATVYPLQFIVEQIGGDTVMTHSVYPPGADGHTYEPTSKDMTQIAKSDAFIYIGKGMEGFAESMATALASYDVSLVELSNYEELFKKSNTNKHKHWDKKDTTITIEGVADHYHTGDKILLTATQDSSYNHWHWYALQPDATEWETVAGQYSATFEGVATQSNVQLKAVLFDDKHQVIAESNPVVVVVDDHGNESHQMEEQPTKNEQQEEDSLTIEGVAGHYHTGDRVKLQAIYQGAEALNHWHWFTRETDRAEWEAVEGQTNAHYEGEAFMTGQQIKAVVYDKNHEMIAESTPVTITIDDHLEHDPHIWTDPLRVINVAEIIKEELVSLNPKQQKLYNDNFESLKKKLTALDHQFKELLDKKENKVIIVPHAAFGYWEERYGVKQIPISGLTSSDEPSQKALTEVIKAAKKYDIQYILYEQNSKNRLSKVIQEQIGAQAVTIHNLEVRTEQDIADGKDYIQLMEDNLKILDQVTK